jgi:S1-C subfamily serine protease
MDDELDLCLLISEGLPATAANIRIDRALAIGEPVYAIGAPRGLELSLSNGIVSQYRQQPSTYPSNYRLIQTTAAVSAGSSGGGLFDSTGRLVGITSFFVDESQNLNFAVPAAAIEDVLHASLLISNMMELARDPTKKFASTLDRDLPGWRQDLESKAFRRWLGLARDAKGQRRTGGISGLSLIALPPDSWQAAVDLFVDYRSSAFYR